MRRQRRQGWNFFFKKQIRDEKRKVPIDVQAESSRKKTRPDEGQDIIVEDNPNEDVAPKEGNKIIDPSPFFELERFQRDRRMRLQTNRLETG